MVVVGTSGFSFGKLNRFAFRGRLDAYARKLKAVEVDSTYYGPLRAATARTWMRQTPTRFSFLLKAHRSIVNSRQPTKIKAHWRRFWRTAKLLKPKLKGVLLEFRAAIQFTPANFQALRAMSRLPSPGVQKYVELRHPSWMTPETIKKIERMGLRVVVIHVAGRWTPLAKGFHPNPQWVREPRYVRLHGTAGKYIGAYSQALLKKIRRVAGRGYAMFNNVDSNKNAERMPDGLSDAMKLGR